MLRFPWFNDHILKSVFDNFIYYFSYRHLYAYILFVAAFNILNVLLIKYLFNKTDYSFFSKTSYPFRCRTAGEKTALFVLVATFALYVANIFSLDGTVFNAYDAMNIDNLHNMLRGVKPVLNSVRFNPIAGIDHNIVYAVTSNYRAVDCWIVIKQAICLFLLYKFYNFVPVDRRFFVLSAIMLIPAVYWVNNIIFSEQNTLIFVLCSFICLKKYDNEKRTAMLFAFAVFSNLAIYTKESNIFLYAGILMFFVLRRVFREEIVLKSFLSPFKALAAMPVEYLLFCNMLVFSVFYLLTRDLLTDGVYLVHNHRDMLELLQIYRLELVINLAALFLLVIRLCKAGNLLQKGIICGCTLISFFIVFDFQIAGYPDYYKSWYLYLPAVFCTGYFFSYLSKKAFLWFFIPFIVFSGYKDYQIGVREEGKSRHELADYIISQGDKTSWFVDKANVSDSWKFECFNAALKHVYPFGELFFKTNHRFRPVMGTKSNSFFMTVLSEEATDGDYVIVHKNDNPYFSDKNMLLMYENDFYQVYRHQ